MESKNFRESLQEKFTGLDGSAQRWLKEQIGGKTGYFSRSITSWLEGGEISLDPVFFISVLQFAEDLRKQLVNLG